MLSTPQKKYAPFQPFHNPGRTWPDKTLTKPPIWLSTDLRDGNQSLSKPLTFEQKWEFFHMLVAIGFTELEVCFPAASQVEFDFTRHLVETPGAVPENVRLRGLSPTREDFLSRTVAALRGAKRASVCTYICISDKQLRYQGFTREQALEQVVKSVRYLRSITKDDPASAAETEWSMAFGLESFNEADLDFASLITEAVKEAWEPTIENPMVVVIASSTEVATPNIWADHVELYRKTISEPDKVLISVHTHNDRGCGVAAAELGMLAGADMVEGCLFGNGERSGNADLVTLALNLYSRGIHPGLDFSNLYEIKSTFEKLTGLHVHQRAPYAGEFALQAFSGTHQNIIRKGIARRVEAAKKQEESFLWDIPYLPVDPEDLGIPLDEIIRVNSQSGKAAAAWILSRQWGLDIAVALQIDFGRRIQTLCETLAREVLHKEVLSTFIASYSLAPSVEVGAASPESHITVSRIGTRYSVNGTIRTDENLNFQLNGSGDDIPSAVLSGLHFMNDVGVVANIEHKQALKRRHGKPGVCALATCKNGHRVFWGYHVDETSESAQALAVVAAAVHMHRSKSSSIPKENHSVSMQLGVKPVQASTA